MGVKLGSADLEELRHTQAGTGFFFSLFRPCSSQKEKKNRIKKCYNTFLVSTHTVLCDIYLYGLNIAAQFISIETYHFSANQHGCITCVEKSVRKRVRYLQERGRGRTSVLQL